MISARFILALLLLGSLRLAAERSQSATTTPIARQDPQAVAVAAVYDRSPPTPHREVPNSSSSLRLTANNAKAAAEVEKSLRAWEQAYIDRDIPALEKILADDFTGIWSDGSVTSKKDEIADLKSGKYKLLSVTFHEIKVRLYGATAVSTALATSDQEYEGKREKLTGWATGVWVKKLESWKLVSIHTSKASPASGRPPR